MQRTTACRVAALGAFVALGAAIPANGQTNVKVVQVEVVDDRISEGLASGGLVLVLNLAGDGMDGVASARIRVKSAKTDGGEDLLPAKVDVPDFSERNTNAGNLQIVLKSPPRTATKVKVSGIADLFVPGRDPAALVKVPGAFSRLDKPVASKGLKAAKVDLTLLSKAKYVEERKKNRLDEKKIAGIRAEAKERGMKDEETDAMIEMAKAFDEIGEGDLPEHGFYLKIPKAADEKIQDLWVETAGGETVETGGYSSRTDEGFVLKQVALKAAAPKDAVLAVRLLTDKTIVSFPFELNEVVLP